MGTRIICKNKHEWCHAEYFILQISFETDTYLLLVDDIDAGLYVREGMGCRQDGFAFVLLMQVPVGSAVQSEGSAVHESAQVVVLIKVGDSFF